jgi:hypothetical protein
VNVHWLASAFGVWRSRLGPSQAKAPAFALPQGATQGKGWSFCLRDHKVDLLYLKYDITCNTGFIPTSFPREFDFQISICGSLLKAALFGAEQRLEPSLTTDLAADRRPRQPNAERRTLSTAYTLRAGYH